MKPAGVSGPTGHCHEAGAGTERRLLLPLLQGIPGLVHGFTTRGSDPHAVIAAAAGRSLPLFAMSQQHGREVHEVRPDGAPPVPAERPRGDALITRRRGIGLQVEVADCVPILICDPVGGFIGAVHAGWRGTVAGIVTASIRALNRRGSQSTDLLVALGPSIGDCCFEVGEEVAAEFRRLYPRHPSLVTDGPPARVDLIEANRRQALQGGVPAERIASSGLCTACRPDLLESHRRSRGAAGRMAGLIAWTS